MHITDITPYIRHLEHSEVVVHEHQLHVADFAAPVFFLYNFFIQIFFILFFLYVADFAAPVSVLEFRVWGLEFRVWGLGSRV